MREMKFRGLRTDGKGWVYGMLFHNNKIVTETVSYESPLVEKGSPCYKYDYINIIPESVGQFTGLHDKNGEEIYEGDAVRIVFNQNANSYNGSNVNLTEHICIVEYNAAMAGFCLRNTTDKTPSKHNSKVISFNHYRLRDVREIIGNIHENPELLKA